MRKIKRISGIIICVLTIFAIWYVINMVRISSYSKKSFDCKSDVALVLGAGTYNGQLSPVYRERVNHAINLLQIDSVKYILLTGGYGENQAISDSEVARQYVLSKGVNNDKILFEEKSKITFYNILFAKRIMDSLHLESALLVSDPYHMLRAKKMCEKVGISCLPSPTPTTMFRSGSSKFKLLRREAFFLWVYQIFGQFRNTKSDNNS